MFRAESIEQMMGGKTVLKSISFTLEPGTFLAVLGANGAGKSTLLRTLSGDAKPHKGQVFFEDKPLSSWAPNQLARKRAVLMQRNAVSFAFTVRQLVEMGRYPYGSAVHPDTNRAIVDDVMKRCGVFEYAERPITALSGGEQQRAHLARVLAQISDSEGTQQKYLLLDEPISSLDIPYQHKTLAIVKDFVAQGNAAMAVLHDVNLAAQFANKIMLLRQGEQLAYGPTDDMLNDTLLTSCYNYPVCVCAHPMGKRRMAYYGATESLTLQ